VLVLKSQYGPAQGSCAQQEGDVGQQASTHTVQKDDGMQVVIRRLLPARRKNDRRMVESQHALVVTQALACAPTDDGASNQ
jgi:hypothetical protein